MCVKICKWSEWKGRKCRFFPRLRYSPTSVDVSTWDIAEDTISFVDAADLTTGGGGGGRGRWEAAAASLA